jgi:hypothetical protein
MFDLICPLKHSCYLLNSIIYRIINTIILISFHSFSILTLHLSVNNRDTIFFYDVQSKVSDVVMGNVKLVESPLEYEKLRKLHI